MDEIPMTRIPDTLHPWRTIFDLAASTDDSSTWLLVGGLMVQLHALMHSAQSRPTLDADVLVNVLAHRQAVHSIVQRLRTEGFEIQDGSLTGYTTRLRRGNDTVDLLAINHLPERVRRFATMNGLPMIGMPGSRQAIRRSMMVRLDNGQSQATLCMPDPLGALLAKAAAWREVGGDAKERHLMDAALLASLIDNPDAATARIDPSSRSDRRNVTTLAQELLGPNGNDYMDFLTDEQRMKAIICVELLAESIGFTR